MANFAELETKEYRTIQRYYSSLVDNLGKTVDPAHFARKLQEESLISESLVNKASVVPSGLTGAERITPVINAVQAQINLKAGNFHKFVSVLKAENSCLAGVISEYYTSSLELHALGVLESVSDWQELGRQLHIDPEKLLHLSQCDRDPEYCREQVVLEWLKEDKGASWSNLCSSLEQMGSEAEVLKIREQYVSDVVPAVTSSEESVIAEQVDEFDDRFADLAFRLQTEMEEKETPVKKFRHSITYLPQTIRKEHLKFIEDSLLKIKQAKDIEDLFMHLNLYWNFFDYNLLEHFVRRHGSKELKKDMEMYAEDLKAFRKSTTVEQLLQVCPDGFRRSEPPPEFIQISSKLNQKASEYTLEELEQFRHRFCSELSLPTFALMLVSPKEGSVTITWHIPSSEVHRFHSTTIQWNSISTELVQFQVDGLVLEFATELNEIMEPSVPLWYMPAPPGYPWTNMVLLPTGCTPEEKVTLVGIIKQKGNDSLSQGNSYDALWKYVHALELCRNLNLTSEMAVLHGDCAQACLNLKLYPDVYIHTSNCIQLDPNAHKAFFHRAEAIQQAMVSGQGIPSYLGVENIISNFIQCHRIKQNAKALCEAIIVAVDHNKTQFLLTLVDHDLQSGFCTKLLQEMVSNQKSHTSHIYFLVFDMHISRQSFDCSTIRLSDLIEKKVTNIPLFVRLFDCGLQVSERDFAVIVSDLPDSDSSVEVLDLILTRYSQKLKTLDEPCQVAMKAGKKLIGSCFLKHGATAELTLEPQELVAKIKEEGNSLFKEGNYHEALGKYYRALEICSKQGGLEKEMAVIYSNCAQVCLNLKLFKDAYEHANKSIELNLHWNKSYYCRAEALKIMLQSPELKAQVPPMKSITNVVQDYCCVKKNSTALVEAIILAVNHDCTQIMLEKPVIESKHAQTELFNELLSRSDCKQEHLKFLVLHLLAKVPFSATTVNLSKVLQVPVSDQTLIQRLIDCNMKVEESDIETAVETLNDTSIDVLKAIISAKEGKIEHVDSYIYKAVRSKKLRVVSCLLQLRADPDFDLVTHALEKKDESTAKQLWQILKPSFDPSKVNISTLITTSLADYPDFVGELLDAGVSPNGSGKKKSLVYVIGLTYLSPTKRNHLIGILLEKGADCNQLCVASKFDTTPLHIVTKFALEAVHAGGDTGVIDALVASPTFAPPGRDGKVVDAKGKTPFHIAIQEPFKKEASVAVLTSLIKTHGIPISPFVQDKNGKQAKEYIQKKDDERLALLEQAAKTFSSSACSSIEKSKRKKKKRSSQSQAEKTSRKKGKERLATAAFPDSPATEKVADQTDPKKLAVPHYAKSSVPQKLEIHKKKGISMKQNYTHEKYMLKQGKISPNSTTRELGLQSQDEVNHSSSLFQHIPKSRDISPNSTTRNSDSQSQDGTDRNLLIPYDTAKEWQATPSTTSGSEMEDVAEAADISELFSQYGFHHFDKLPWEVEVTNKVKEFLKDERNNSKALRVSVVRTIYQLAEGQRGTHLAKAVSGVHDLHLYRAKMNKGGRILWEKAIQFSPRQTHSHTTPIYSQVIRIWDIVPNHDHLTRCIKQVESSFRRGNSAAINFSLLPQVTNKCEPVRSREQLEIPKTFLLQSDSQELVPPVQQQFIPAASMKKDEYNVTYFYSFSSAMVKSVLIGGEHRRDFPFKGWPKEHEIINLQINESIFLLGRSGTGKTTCCLYRLWNEFKLYWDPEIRHPDSKLPRIPLLSKGAMEDHLVACQEDKEKEKEKEKGEGCTKFDQVTEMPTIPASSCISCSPGVEDVCGDDESMKHAKHSLVSEQLPKTQRYSGADDNLEDLHQVFITKNHVLCTQMKHRFFDMVAAHDFLKKHLKFENENIPSKLSCVNDLAYPLFLTARQFYILLDNSLEDEKRFFPRADDGTLKVKFISTDYDHEDVDTLLDLEQSDDEDIDALLDVDLLDDKDGDVNLGKEPGIQGIQPKQFTSKVTSVKWIEMTSLYFTETVWPAIVHKCGKEALSLDPLLVWTEIQSFIKGSEEALRKGSPLTIDEYRAVGNQMAPNFANQRDCIYNSYLHYKQYCLNKRHHIYLFDECDLVQQLYHRLCELKDVSWSIHCFYIDEVQDFTQAELALFLHCCRDPNSNFFTGDTAQSIMRGIAFRFQDLQSLFYRIHNKVPQVKVPHKPFTLTINFRSHSGILKMAGSVIDLLTSFFRGSIDDNLPEDKGMFPGPTPVLIESCEVSDLAFLLSSNERESSTIEFGCHQAILVQSVKAKEKLPDILQGAIVLTIFEAKGLEFDDVLLYNFFTDSPVDDKCWRVVTSYLQQNPTCVINDAKAPGTDREPRSLEFDEKQHKSLSADLKYLYTAITRAKCNLWIYDSNKEKRLPMWNYWYKRDLVKVVSYRANEGLEEGKRNAFALKTTKDQWKTQGDYFKRKHLWEQAMHCYHVSGDEYLALEAKAHNFIQQARQQGHLQYYSDAAHCFLKCNDFHCNVNYLKFAALCLMKTQPPRYSEAAKLFERLEERTRAFNAFKKARDAENCARLREEEGRYTEAIRVLDHFNERLKALAKAANFEKQGFEIESDVTVNELSYKYAKMYAAKKEERMLCAVLEYLNDLQKRAWLLKEGGFFEKAFEIYKSQRKFKEAFRLAIAQMAASFVASNSKDDELSSAKVRKAKKWYDRAIFLAEEQEDEKMKVLVFLQALKLQFCNFVGDHSFTESYEGNTLETICRSYRDQDIQAHAKLLMYRINKDNGICKDCEEMYKLLRHNTGQLEAYTMSFHLIEEESRTVIYLTTKTRELLTNLFECKLTKNDAICRAVKEMLEFLRHKRIELLRRIFKMCQLAAETRELLANSNESINAKRVTQQALEFFNLQKVGNEYVIPQGQEAWLGELFKKCKVKRKKGRKKYLLDHDGMLRLDGAAVRSALVKHYLDYENKWFEWIKVLTFQQIPHHFSSFSSTDAKSSLLSMNLNIEMLVQLIGYIKNCILHYEVSISSHFYHRDTMIFTLFSPQMSLRKKHRIIVKKSHFTNALLRNWVKEMLKEAEKRDEINFDANLWLLLWRTCCLIDEEMTIINKSLDQRTMVVNNEATEFDDRDNAETTGSTVDAKSESRQPASSENKAPVAFYFWRKDKRYYHLFSYWLWSCKFMKNGQVSYSSRCVVKYFLGTDARVNISVCNIVDIFALHCTSLLAILTHINAFQTHFQVPFLYECIVQLFDDLNVHTKEDKSVMEACTEEVLKKQRSHQKLINDCQYVLRTMLDILLGYHAHFRILSYAFKHEDSLRSGTACHCLILTLTIFGNLIRSKPPAKSKPRTMKDYQQKLCSILGQIQKKPSAPEFVREAFQVLELTNFHDEIFHLITKLLQRSCRHGRLMYLQLKEVPNRPPRVCFIEPDRLQPQPPTWSQQQQQQAPHHACHSIIHSPVFVDPSVVRFRPVLAYPSSVSVSTSPPPTLQSHYMQLSSTLTPYLLPPASAKGLVTTSWQCNSTQPFYPFQDNPQASQILFPDVPQITQLPAITYPSIFFTSKFAQQPSMTMDHCSGYCHTKDLNQALSHAQRSKVESVQDEMSDATVIDSTFCYVCHVPLRLEVTHTSEEDDTEIGASPTAKSVVEQSIESYHSHIKSDGHVRNMKLFKNPKEEYKGLVKEILAICRSIKCQPSALASVLVGMDELNNSKVAELTENLTRIEEFCDKMHLWMTSASHKFNLFSKEPQPAMMADSNEDFLPGFGLEFSEEDLQASEVMTGYDPHSPDCHVRNIKLLKEVYKGLVKEVEEMLTKCHSIEHKPLALARVLDDMDEQRVENEKKVSELTENHAYTELIEEIGQMCDKMHLWLRRAELEFMKLDITSHEHQDPVKRVIANADDDSLPKKEPLMPEHDEDSINEDLDQALSQVWQGETLSVQNKISDATIIDPTFCYVCHVPFRLEVTHTSKDDTEAGPLTATELSVVVDPSFESYQSHIRSGGHVKNVKLFNKFKQEEKLYESLVKEVGEMLAKCHSIEHKPSTLARVLDDMDEQRVKNEREVAELMESHAYTKLIEEISMMCDRMQSQLKYAQSEYMKLDILEETEEEEEEKEGS